MRKYISIIILVCSFCIWWACSAEGVVPSNNSTATNTGVGGSLAKFAIVGNFLYVINDIDLKTYDITQPETPKFVGTTAVGWGIETLYPYGKNLFLGSQRGVYLYEIQPDGKPIQKSFYQHFQACDPVVASGQYAYSTIRSGFDCRIRDTINELHILDVSDINKPVMVSKVKMTNPIGLGIDGNTLFVCDAGLRILDVTDKKNPRELHHLKDIDAIDVIVLSKHLLIIGTKTLTQVDYKDIAKPVVVSKLPLKS